MDAEREALQSTAYPEVQTFCQKHGLMFEVIAPRPLTVSATRAGIRAPCSEGLHTRTTDESPLKKAGGEVVAMGTAVNPGGVPKYWEWMPCNSAPWACHFFFFIIRFTFFFFLAVLGLRCCTWDFSSCREQGLLFVAPNAGVPGLIPGQGVRPHMLQLRAHMPPLDLAQPNK